MHLEQFADRLPSQLSGGQRQRMALARALAVEPKVLLLDEPFGALDAKVRRELRDWLRRLHDEVHVTTVFVTHDQEEALEVSDEIVVINHGRIEQVGTPADLYDKPANEFVMEFLGPVTTLGGRLVRPHDIEHLPRPRRARGRGARSPGCSASASRCAPNCTHGRQRAVGAADPRRRPRRWHLTDRLARVGPRAAALSRPAKMSGCRSRQRRTTRCVRCSAWRPTSRSWSRSTSIVREQGLPRKFVEAILGELRRADLVRSQRGADGGYALARPAAEITLGAVIRAVDGPLAEVRGLRPHETNYAGVAEHLPEVWVAVRASLRRVLDETTLAQVLAGKLPAHVERMVAEPGRLAAPLTAGRLRSAR